MLVIKFSFNSRKKNVTITVEENHKICISKFIKCVHCENVTYEESSIESNDCS